MSNRNEINLSKRKTFPDSEAAKYYVVQYLTSRMIDETFNDDTNCLNAIESLKSIIRNKRFSIKLNMVTEQPNIENDIDLLARLEASQTDKRIKAITDFIYSIRCNVFHAQKDYVQSQISVLNSINTLLQKLIELLFYKLKIE